MLSESPIQVSPPVNTYFLQPKNLAEACGKVAELGQSDDVLAAQEAQKRVGMMFFIIDELIKTSTVIHEHMIVSASLENESQTASTRGKGSADAQESSSINARTNADASQIELPSSPDDAVTPFSLMSAGNQNSNEFISLSSNKNSFGINQVSLSGNAASSSSASRSQRNTMGWLMQIFDDLRDSHMATLQYLGGTAENAVVTLNKLRKVATDVKAILRDVKNGDWTWGDKVDDGDGGTEIVPRPEVQAIIDAAKELGITMGGMDIKDWLVERTEKHKLDHGKEPGQSLKEPGQSLQDVEDHLSEAHGYNPSWFEKFKLGLSAISQNFGGIAPTNYRKELKKAVGCLHNDKKELNVANGDLLNLSQTLDNAMTEQSDANSKLQNKIMYHNQLLQAFQTAFVSMSAIIGSLMKESFVQMKI